MTHVLGESFRMWAHRRASRLEAQAIELEQAGKDAAFTRERSQFYALLADPSVTVEEIFASIGDLLAQVGPITMEDYTEWLLTKDERAAQDKRDREPDG